MIVDIDAIGRDPIAFRISHGNVDHRRRSIHHVRIREDPSLFAIDDESRPGYFRCEWPYDSGPDFDRESLCLAQHASEIRSGLPDSSNRLQEGDAKGENYRARTRHGEPRTDCTCWRPRAHDPTFTRKV